MGGVDSWPEPSGKGSGSVRQEGVGEGEERMGSIYQHSTSTL